MNKAIVLIVLVLLSACKPETENTDKILSYLSSFEKNIKDIEAIFIVPNGGCPGCISNFESKLYENPASLSKMIIVYTEIQDIKKLRLLLPEHYFKHNNVIFDYDNSLRRNGFSSFYPYCIVMNKGTVARDFFLDGTSESNEHYLNKLFHAK